MSYINIDEFVEHIGEYNFAYDPEKAAKLKLERGIDFDQVVALISGHEFIAIRQHHNPDRYHRQFVCEVEINDYVYLVPLVVRGKEVFLKTFYPSRKATKKRGKRG